ncbi:DUF6817 domain-containing protein [Pseudarthrobacter sp. L1SW]|uniref:DUF6817 domain-containing protein n=1 Tax=Pseudarthrobacter sp. L1SW TaxID=2851598 RepID=UPI001E5B151D|nr:hypothetical protein [Pseudarthrobacter sp. L1SW]UEL30073.1 hypothetical protein KTR40_08285 [Pseudarthrobacter sp. L1SW]
MHHLFGVHQILVAWGCAPAVCTAGLFHSTYGTEFYTDSLFDIAERQRLKQLIGNEAEALVYAFCRISRTSLLDDLPVEIDNGEYQVSEEQLAALRCIEMANLLEQQAAPDRSPAVFICRLWQLARSGVALDQRHPIMGVVEFSVEEEREALFAYQSALGLNPLDLDSVGELLNRCALGLVLGEPFILLAAIQLDRGDWAAAMCAAGEGRDILVRWGCPWDKRLSFGDWLALAGRVRELAELGATGTDLWPQLRSMLVSTGIR